MHRSLLLVVLSVSVLLSTLVAAQDASYTFITFDVPGATHTEAFGINDNGQVVGRVTDATGGLHGFLKDGATLTPIDVPGATQTYTFGINKNGQIVGTFSYATGLLQGFLKDGDTFTTIDVPGAVETVAKGINTTGQVVGTFRDSTGQYHGFLATPSAEDKKAKARIILTLPISEFGLCSCGFLVHPL